jgi:predicted ATP-dependent endonuclease of OLD family
MSNMIIKKVIINNFKSIEHIELDFDKIGNSYTKIFVGINESGKSNILEALSFFKVQKTNVSFDSFCNQKLEDCEKCEISFYLELGDNNCNINGITDLSNKPQKIKFKISNIVKRVSLQKKKNKFESLYDYDVELLDNNTFIKKGQGYDNIYNPVDKYIINNKRVEGFELLTKELFLKFFRKIISEMIEKKEPEVSMWKPSPDYILSNINLFKFKENINSSKPLKNIFYLSGYTEEKIKEIIDKVPNHTQRSILSSRLNTAINNYIGRVWSNKISIVIEIADTGNLSFLIKDQGVENEHNRFEITDRSQGAQQFLSLILSLSLEAENHERKNEIILIDEPEVHLHPSGIRDLGKELLKVGNENYVFLATHSPFIIDKRHKERHYIVKKNKKAITEITRIRESDNIIDDEVLNEAFGINVYRDLLNPHSVLVEGASDKIILQKAFDCLGYNGIGITNGHGSNIDTLASKMNFDNISVLVVTDDDKDGRKYKENILKIGGAYNDETVYTIRDLEGGIIDQGTIEDTLGCKYVESQFIKYYKSQFNEDLTGLTLSEDKPLLIQIISILKEKKKYNNWNMDSFKKQLSEEFNPTKTSFSTKFKLLKALAEKIKEKLFVIE